MLRAENIGASQAAGDCTGCTVFTILLPCYKTDLEEQVRASNPSPFLQKETLPPKPLLTDTSPTRFLSSTELKDHTVPSQTAASLSSSYLWEVFVRVYSASPMLQFKPIKNLKASQILSSREDRNKLLETTLRLLYYIYMIRAPAQFSRITLVSQSQHSWLLTCCKAAACCTPEAALGI